MTKSLKNAKGQNKKESNCKNMDKMKFTISASPALSKANFELLLSERVIQKLKSYSGKIYDINFTCHIEPFIQDAHGVYLTPEENEIHLRHMVKLQEKTGILVSPVFNNIYVPNTYENLKQFVSSFKRLYDMGIRSITVPHLLWMKMGLIQKTFPGLHIKNTVLRRVRNGQDFWNHAEVGFNYVNLDRILVRDQHVLKEIRAAQKKFWNMTGKYVVTSILEGEGCLGICPLWEEHYQHTLTHPDIDKNLQENLDLFRLPQNFSCFLIGAPSINPIISVGLPFFREDIDDICQYFDVVKLAGRRAFQSLCESLKKIEDFFYSHQPVITDTPEAIKTLYENPAKYSEILTKYRKKIKTCRFQCWNCSICSDIAANMI